MYYDDAVNDIKHIFAEVERKHWEQEVVNAVSFHLAKAQFYIVYLLAWLEHFKMKDGWGRTMEKVAKTERHYDGVLEYFASMEKSPIQDLFENHPALFEFLHVSFRDYLLAHLHNEENYNQFSKAFERGDEEEIIKELCEVWLVPSEEFVREGAVVIIGFLERYDLHQLLKFGMDLD